MKTFDNLREHFYLKKKTNKNTTKDVNSCVNMIAVMRTQLTASNSKYGSAKIDA